MKDFPESIVDYLVEFHGTRDYFECHEILEEFWKEQGLDSPLSLLWIGLIQIAVGQYHHRRGNIAGAEKMLSQALANLDRDDLDRIGIDGEKLLQILKTKLNDLSQRKEQLMFTDFDIPLREPELIRQCRFKCERAGVDWGAPSRMEDESLIHRHTLRDRSDVIAARQASAEDKRKRKERASE